MYFTFSSKATILFEDWNIDTTKGKLDILGNNLPYFFDDSDVIAKPKVIAICSTKCRHVNIIWMQMNYFFYVIRQHKGVVTVGLEFFTQRSLSKILPFTKFIIQKSNILVIVRRVVGCFLIKIIKKYNICMSYM